MTRLADAVAARTGTSVGMGEPLFRRTSELRDVKVPMRDGTHLLTDIYHPVGGGDMPVLLIRTPYGRRAIGGLIERATALRGFHVVSQSCRGTFGSGGVFRPFRDDGPDGADTVDWLEQQPWFRGQLVLGGLSYSGWAAWAVAATIGPSRVSALVIQHAATTVQPVFRPHGVLAFSTLANWVYLQSIRDAGVMRTWWGTAIRRRRVARAVAGSPQNADTALTGGPVLFYQEVIRARHPADPLWSDSDHGAALTADVPPTHIMTGWFDFFLDAALADYATLVDRGAAPFLTISIGAHLPDVSSMKLEYPEMFAWFRAATTTTEPQLRPSAVRVQLLGSKQWHDLTGWPPPATDLVCFLTADGALVDAAAAEAAPNRAFPVEFNYRPDDPTPSIGGQVMYDSVGQVDNRTLEGRPDVLAFTGPVLTEPLTVVGVARLEFGMTSTAPSTHLFARLCDVAPNGVSRNLTDGIVELDCVPGPTQTVQMQLSATGFTIQSGHRLRLTVSSGAHPRYAAPEGPGTITIDRGVGRVAQLVLPAVHIAD